MVKVKGTMRATAMVAVKPGRAPAIMPKTIATSMKSMFCRVKIAAMDSIKICMVIMNFLGKDVGCDGLEKGA
jgi:hypothetical protein